MRKFHQDFYIGIIGLIFCAFVLFMNVDLKGSAGVMPLLLDALLAAFSLIIFIGGLKKSNDKKFLTYDVLKYPVFIWCLVGVYVLLFWLTGYLVSSAVMIPTLMIFMKQRNFKVIFSITAVYVLLVYFVFIKILGVSAGGLGVLGRMFS